MELLRRQMPEEVQPSHTSQTIGLMALPLRFDSHVSDLELTSRAHKRESDISFYEVRPVLAASPPLETSKTYSTT